MNRLDRLRASSSPYRIGLLCASLLASVSFTFAADHSVIVPPRGSLSAAALFDHDDALHAMKLAKLELERRPHDADAWFVTMEAAHMRNDQAEELKGAVNLCKWAQAEDPRLVAAASRLSGFGLNSEMFRRERESVEEIAQGNSGCAATARDVLYSASLDGLPHSNVRALGQRSGWLTKWTIARASVAGRPSEAFEFADARIQLPDYFARSATYAAEAQFIAPQAGRYVIGGDVAGGKLFVDGQTMPFGSVDLSQGAHTLRVVFRGGESSLRIQVTPSSDAGELGWTKLYAGSRESVYLHAAVALAQGYSQEAAQEIRYSSLQQSDLGQKFLEEVAHPTAAAAQFESAAAHPSCGNLNAALSTANEPNTVGELLLNCAPDSLAYAHWLAGVSRHADSIRELGRVLHEWPLDREAHRMLIAELQRAGNNVAADRAAAEFLAIAPNARYFRRMAQNASADSEQPATPFYERYRRPAPAALPLDASSGAVILLQDKVAIARLDGSVSLYLHRVVQLMSASGAEQFRPLSVPDGGQLLTARVINNAHVLPSALRPGDEIEEEYVVNYTGDGGMIAHPEAFQYVFNDFDFPLIDARFVVLSPSTQSPGYVIASGPVPDSTVDYADGFRAQIWEKQQDVADLDINAPAIVRVVENENGWSIPPSVERKRILETIHPGPRNREA